MAVAESQVERNEHCAMPLDFEELTKPARIRRIGYINALRRRALTRGHVP